MLYSAFRVFGVERCIAAPNEYGASGTQRAEHESLDIDSKSFTQKQEVGHTDRMNGIQKSDGDTHTAALAAQQNECELSTQRAGECRYS